MKLRTLWEPAACVVLAGAQAVAAAKGPQPSAAMPPAPAAAKPTMVVEMSSPDAARLRRDFAACADKNGPLQQLKARGQAGDQFEQVRGRWNAHMAASYRLEVANCVLGALPRQSARVAESTVSLVQGEVMNARLAAAAAKQSLYAAGQQASPALAGASTPVERELALWPLIKTVERESVAQEHEAPLFPVRR